MKIASFNIENLFARHRDLLLGNDEESELLVQDFDALIYQEDKSNKDLTRMRKLWEVVGINLTPEKSRDAFEEYENHILSNIENLKDRPGIISIYHEMAKNPDLCPIYFEEIENKAKMILEVGADVLVLQEVEGQAAMEEFNRYFLNGSYEHIYFTPTRDILGRSMGLLLKQGVKLCSIKSISASPLFDGRSIPRGFIQLYEVQSEKKGCLELVNIHLIQSDNKDYATFSEPEMVSIADIIIKNTSNVLPSFSMGSLNITSFSSVYQALITRLGFLKLNELDCFEAKLDKGKDSKYHSLGAYAKGVNIMQFDYLLSSNKWIPFINKSGLVSPTQLSNISKPVKQDNLSTRKALKSRATACLWFELK